MEETDQKNSIESAKYDTGIQFFFPCTCIYWAFFMDPDPNFPGRIRIFWPIRIWTREKKVRSGSEKQFFLDFQVCRLLGLSQYLSCS